MAHSVRPRMDRGSAPHLVAARRALAWPRVWEVAVQIAMYLVLVALGVLFVAPLIWLVSTSLKIESQVYAFPPDFIPRPVTTSNYAHGVADFPFWTATWNTVVIVVGVMLGNLLTCSFTAYVFARMRFPLRETLFVLVLSTLMVPYYVYLLPQYILFRDLGWLNSPLPLIVPYLFGQSPFFIFLLRQFFRTIPREYDEAARIDGCGLFDIYWRIMLPLIKPALGATAILTFMGTWSDFLAPTIYLNQPEKQTLAIALSNWQRNVAQAAYKQIPWGEIMAVSVLIAIPPTLLFFFTQRYFIQGVVVSGVKG